MYTMVYMNPPNQNPPIPSAPPMRQRWSPPKSLPVNPESRHKHRRNGNTGVCLCRMSVPKRSRLCNNGNSGFAAYG